MHYSDASRLGETDDSNRHIYGVVIGINRILA
jgi:hypothetical protein